jgi:hypothetical protein
VAKTGGVLNLNETSRKKFLEQESEVSVAAENCRTLLGAPVKSGLKYVTSARVSLHSVYCSAGSWEL